MGVNVDLVSEKERFFRSFQVWPLASRFDARLWRENFSKDELVFADRLLRSFTYFSEAMVDALLLASVQRYLNTFYTDKPKSISDFIFVSVEGEEPHPTDSGHVFLRKVRDNLSVAEASIKKPDDAIKMHQTSHHFIFVDDFVGSGNQMVETWTRPRQLIDGSFSSFSDLATSGVYSFGYCPCISSFKGRETLSKLAPSLNFRPAHELTRRHNASESDAYVWEGINASEALDFLKSVSARVGFDREDGGQRDWRGFHMLGLSLGLHDSIPDACLPIYFSAENGWKPLMRRAYV